MVHSILDPAGPQAAHIAHLWWLMFWTTSAVFVIVLGFLAWAVSRASGRVRTPPVDEAVDAPLLTRAVSIGVGITVVILFVFLVSSMRTGRLIASLAPESAVTISITGH